MNYIENLQVLKDHLAQVPEIDLRSYFRTAECGTLYCAAGWLPHIEHFQRLGIMAGDAGQPVFADEDLLETMQNNTPVEFWCDEPDLVAIHLFGTFYHAGYEDGVSSWHHLFAPRAAGAWDGELFTPDMTDKELALARLDYAIEELTK